MRRHSVLLILLLSAAAMFLSCDNRTDSQGEKDATLTEDKGFLFSAILFDNTPLGERWAQLRPEAEELFPHLKLKAVPDLHVTIIYIGGEWDAGKLTALRQTVSISVTEAIHPNPEIAYFGSTNHTIAVELKGIPETLQEQIIGTKMKLNEAGLKSPDRYDDAFRAHVTLAQAKDKPPTAEQARELEAFREWIEDRLDFATLDVVLDSTMPIQWMLAGASRPTPIPEYITVESFLSAR